MAPQGDDNPFLDRRNALDWAEMVESEKGRVREGDIYPLLKKWVDQAAPLEILEIGAGQGICSEKIDLEGRAYTGLELSPFLVERAERRYGGKSRRFQVGTADALPFADGAFGAVFSVAVWHLLKDLGKTASELSRVLEAGGHFLIITADPGAYAAWTGRYSESHSEGRRFEGKTKRPDGSVARDVLYLHTLDELTGSLEAAGLRVEETSAIRQFIVIRGRRLCPE